MSDFGWFHQLHLNMELRGRLESLYLASKDRVLVLPSSQNAPVKLTTFRITFPRSIRNPVEFENYLSSILSEDAFYSLENLERLAFVSAEPEQWTPGRGVREIKAMERMLTHVSKSLEELLILPSPYCWFIPLPLSSCKNRFHQICIVPEPNLSST
jgi:hypothetical protein